MRAMIYVLAIALTMAPFASAGAQNAGNPSATPAQPTAPADVTTKQPEK